VDASDAQVKVDESKVIQAQASVVAAEAENARAAADLKRYQDVESRAVSKTDYDLAVQKARSARADLDAANSQVKAAQGECHPEQSRR
jgi:multidrug resistance efflux pump